MMLSISELLSWLVLIFTIRQAMGKRSHSLLQADSLSRLIVSRTNPSFLVLGVSFNQPNFCSNVSWNPIAVTFASQTIVGSSPIAIFITRKNTIVMPRRDNGQILIWQNNTIANSTRTIPAGLSNPFSVFVTSDEQIFVDQGTSNGQVDRWTLNGTRLSSIFFLSSKCFGLFVDVNNRLYCSAPDLQQVLRQSLTDPTNGLTIVAGTGRQGSSAAMLNIPWGIFVTRDLDLYVADFGNNRVQLFREGQRNGRTVAGSGSSGTMDLNGPTSMVVDGDGYLFIVDQRNNRILGSDPNGFRCLVGCSEMSGAGSNQLNYPQTMSFDIDGNIFVTDSVNNRIQKFLVMRNSCGRCQSMSS